MRRLKSSVLALLVAAFIATTLFNVIDRVTVKAQNQLANQCDRSAVISISTATTTSIIDNTATADNPTRIYACEVNLTVIGTATANQITFEYGTGSTCGTGTTVLTGPFTSDATAGVMKVLNLHLPFKPVPVGQRLCILTSQAGVVAGSITYSIF